MVREHLTENGVMVVNMNMHSDGEGSMNEYLCDTIAGVFAHVYTADVKRNTNRELFASVSSDPYESLCAGMAELPEGQLRDMMEQVLSGLESYSGGDSVLTDDQAPVEMLGMKVIDSLISEELDYYKGVFREEGLEGVLGSFG